MMELTGLFFHELGGVEPPFFIGLLWQFGYFGHFFSRKKRKHADLLKVIIGKNYNIYPTCLN